MSTGPDDDEAVDQTHEVLVCLGELPLWMPGRLAIVVYLVDEGVSYIYLRPGTEPAEQEEVTEAAARALADLRANGPGEIWVAYVSQEGLRCYQTALGRTYVWR